MANKISTVLALRYILDVKVYDSFLYNYTSRRGYDQGKVSLLDFIHQYEGFFIDRGFCWAHTPEGHIFWEEKNYWFKNIVNAASFQSTRLSHIRNKSRFRRLFKKYIK